MEMPCAGSASCSSPRAARCASGRYSCSAIRHPSYLGLVVSSLGWALAFRSTVGVLLTALTIVPLVARISAEEKLLRAQFGDAYDAYRRRTWRLIPRIY